MLMEIEINYLAVFAGAIVNMAIGFFWYSPKFGFGKPWMALSGMNPEALTPEQKKGMWKTFLVAFMGGFVMVAVLAFVLSVAQFAAGALSVISALEWAALLWLGFIATTMLGMVLWERKSWKLYFINAGYYLVSLLAVSVILALW